MITGDTNNMALLLGLIQYNLTVDIISLVSPHKSKVPVKNSMRNIIRNVFLISNAVNL